ncbi:hypothetical protein HK102_006626, partial [Quaeritorhiza haematococci]
MQALYLLTKFLRREDAPTYYVYETPLLDTVIMCAMHDTHSVILTQSLTILTIAMPTLSTKLGENDGELLDKLLKVLVRVIEWEAKWARKTERLMPGSDSTSHPGLDMEKEKMVNSMMLTEYFRSAVGRCIDTFFTHLYGMAPWSVLEVLRGFVEKGRAGAEGSGMVDRTFAEGAGAASAHVSVSAATSRGAAVGGSTAGGASNTSSGGTGLWVTPPPTASPRAGRARAASLPQSPISPITSHSTSVSSTSVAGTGSGSVGKAGGSSAAASLRGFLGIGRSASSSSSSAVAGPAGGAAVGGRGSVGGIASAAGVQAGEVGWDSLEAADDPVWVMSRGAAVGGELAATNLGTDQSQTPPHETQQHLHHLVKRLTNLVRSHRLHPDLILCFGGAIEERQGFARRFAEMEVSEIVVRCLELRGERGGEFGVGGGEQKDYGPGLLQTYPPLPQQSTTQLPGFAVLEDIATTTSPKPPSTTINTISTESAPNIAQNLWDLTSTAASAASALPSSTRSSSSLPRPGKGGASAGGSDSLDRMVRERDVAKGARSVGVGADTTDGKERAEAVGVGRVDVGVDSGIRTGQTSRGDGEPVDVIEGSGNGGDDVAVVAGGRVGGGNGDDMGIMRIDLETLLRINRVLRVAASDLVQRPQPPSPLPAPAPAPAPQNSTTMADIPTSPTSSVHSGGFEGDMSQQPQLQITTASPEQQHQQQQQQSSSTAGATRVGAHPFLARRTSAASTTSTASGSSSYYYAASSSSRTAVSVTDTIHPSAQPQLHTQQHHHQIQQLQQKWHLFVCLLLNEVNFEVYLRQRHADYIRGLKKRMLGMEFEKAEGVGMSEKVKLLERELASLHAHISTHLSDSTSLRSRVRSHEENLSGRLRAAKEEVKGLKARMREMEDE